MDVTMDAVGAAPPSPMAASTTADDGRSATAAPLLPPSVAAAVPNLGTLTHTTAMCWAAAEGNVEMMQRLRELGADVNAADYDKRTPLHIAVSDNQLAAVEYLLQCGAATETIDRWGRSPIDCALETKNATILALLERTQYRSSSRSSDLALFDQSAQSPTAQSLQQQLVQRRITRSRSSTDVSAFFRAIEDGNTERVKRAWFDGLALDVTDASGRTSLHIAVEHMRVAMIELLLSADVDTTVVDDAGRTPLSIAVEKQYFAIAEMLRTHQKHKRVLHARDSDDAQHVAQAFRVAKQGDVRALQALVPSLVHPDVQDYDLRTLLHVASAEGHLDSVKYLVECGANVNLLDRWSTSPLSEAIDFAHNRVARFLMANYANESGNRATIAVDQIDSITLNAALEFALRVVTRQRWLLGQVYCPMTEESGNCVLVAHGVWHRNDALLLNRHAASGDVDMASPPPSPTRRSAGAPAAASATTTALAKDPIQMFRKVGSLMMIDPGQGHTGSVFSGQHPEWLNLTTAAQSHFFLLPYARRAGIQTIVSVPMIYKMSTIAVLSWYADTVVAEDPLELQRIQRLLRSVMVLSTLRLEVLAAVASAAGTVHVPRFQYCQSLDTALTANGELIDASVSSEDVAVGDVFPLALEWGLFDMVDKLATSMSSEDHAAVISLLRSIVSLLSNGFFRDAFDDRDSSPRGLSHASESPDRVIGGCNGVVRTKRELVIHVHYYLQYLHSVSPTEGTVFMDANALVAPVRAFVNSRGKSGVALAASASNDASAAEAPAPAPEPPAPAAPAVECILCKYNVSGHIHPGKAAAPAAPAPVAKPVAVSLAPSPSAGDGYFGIAGNPKSPVYREIRTLLAKYEAQYDAFGRKAALADRHYDGLKPSAFTSSDVYDAIGAAHDTPVRRGSSSNPAAEARKRLLDVINTVMQDASCVISLEQLLAIHKCLLPVESGQAGVIRTSAAVGYASPRIYRVFLPVGEITEALDDLVATLNDTERWASRPLLCAYYAFAVLVFYIHPFHDGNGRCGRILCNVIAKKLGYPSLVRAADKTIEVAEFLQKAVVTMEAIQTSRRQTRQSRLLSARKENTSMWF